MQQKQVKGLLDAVLQSIKPDVKTRKEVLGKVNTFLQELNARLKKLNIRARASLGGSYAKDTWLVGDYDVDVFVAFAQKHAGDDMSGLLEKALAPWKPVRLHGSRDYFQIKNGIADGIAYELVPVLAIRKPADAKNTTDFSPLHVSWANAQGKKLKDDIRLFKKFCKANHVYGAESYIRGVSGHVADLLILHYGGFLKALKAVAGWKPKVVLDKRKVYKGKALFIMNASKTEGPLVIVDPVQPERNAASAFSQEKFDLLVKAAQAFLKKPSTTFFEEKRVNWNALAKKGFLIRISCTPLDGKPDVVGTKLLKIFEYIREQLADFGVRTAAWEWDETSDADMWFVLKKSKLADVVVVQGPPLVMKEHCLHFKKKHKNTFVNAGKLFARVAREDTDATRSVERLLRSDFVKERVKNARVLN